MEKTLAEIARSLKSIDNSLKKIGRSLTVDILDIDYILQRIAEEEAD